MTEFLFPDLLSEFVYYRTYSRWRDDLGRREKWPESVDRYFGFLKKHYYQVLTPVEWALCHEYVETQRAMGSMRLLWAAGPAAEQHQFTIYNCTFMTISDLRAFAEALYILMCGCGVGYSCEEQYVSELPRIKKQRGGPVETYVVEDSKEGWAKSLLHGLETWYSGADVSFDFSEVRPRGSRLYTMGGRASGPEPLRNLLEYARALILSRQGRRLTTYQAHCLMCKIAEIVVVGGVRRSSLISLSDLDDATMRDCKVGEFWNSAPHLRMANNSVAYENKPTSLDLIGEWQSLIRSQAGERGIFVRSNARATAPRRKHHPHWGTNPCGEICLRDMQMCNLSEVIARPSDNVDDLLTKTVVAAILGTLQSGFADFRFVRPDWKRNAEDERLLGVSITGIVDCPTVRDANVLERMRKMSIETNRDIALRMGINPSAAITCVKPSGTVSQLVGTSSGLHTRWAKFYIRRVRISATDPLFMLATSAGIPAHPEVGEDPTNPSTWVLEFPIKSPEGSITRHDLTAIEQLELWKMLKVHYTEHNPSATIYVDENEWVAVLKWLDDNWSIVGGLSFLPKTHHVYTLAPYEEISEDEYQRRMSDMPTSLNYDLLAQLEKDDNTTGAQSLACDSVKCEFTAV